MGVFSGLKHQHMIRGLFEIDLLKVSYHVSLTLASNHNSSPGWKLFTVVFPLQLFLRFKEHKVDNNMFVPSLKVKISYFLDEDLFIATNNVNIRNIELMDNPQFCCQTPDINKLES